MTTHTRNISDSTIATLKKLHAINLDSARGFDTVSEHIHNSELQDYLRESAARRHQFASELGTLVNLNDDDRVDANDGSLKATLHCWWIDIRAAVQSDDEHALLAEAERGEDSILAAYRDALKEPLEPAVRDIVENQRVWVKATHDRVRALRDARA